MHAPVCLHGGPYVFNTHTHKKELWLPVGWAGTLEPEWCPAPSFHLGGCSCQRLSLSRGSVQAAGEKSRKAKLETRVERAPGKVACVGVASFLDAE